jgi:hypothetical protein
VADGYKGRGGGGTTRRRGRRLNHGWPGGWGRMGRLAGRRWRWSLDRSSRRRWSPQEEEVVVERKTAEAGQRSTRTTKADGVAR